MACIFPPSFSFNLTADNSQTAFLLSIQAAAQMPLFALVLPQAGKWLLKRKKHASAANLALARGSLLFLTAGALWMGFAPSAPVFIAGKFVAPNIPRVSRLTRCSLRGIHLWQWILRCFEVSPHLACAQRSLVPFIHGHDGLWWCGHNRCIPPPRTILFGWVEHWRHGRVVALFHRCSILRYGRSSVIHLYECWLSGCRPRIDARQEIWLKKHNNGYKSFVRVRNPSGLSCKLTFFATSILTNATFSD